MTETETAYPDGCRMVVTEVSESGVERPHNITIPPGSTVRVIEPNYVQRWATTGSIFHHGLDRSVPWLEALDHARAKANIAAKEGVLGAHFGEFLRRFDEEMDRRHAEIVATYAEMLDTLRNSPEFWLVAPGESMSDPSATPTPEATK